MWDNSFRYCMPPWTDYSLWNLLFWLKLTIFSISLPCHVPFRTWHFRGGQLLFCNVSHVVTIHVHVCHFSHLSVHLCHLMNLTVHVCHLMNLTVHVCHLINLTVHVCHLMNLTVHVCHLINLTVHVCHLMNLTVHVCHLMNLTVHVCHHTNWTVSPCLSSYELDTPCMSSYDLDSPLCHLMNLIVHYCHFTNVTVHVCYFCDWISWWNGSLGSHGVWHHVLSANGSVDHVIIFLWRRSYILQANFKLFYCKHLNVTNEMKQHYDIYYVIKRHCYYQYSTSTNLCNCDTAS